MENCRTASIRIERKTVVTKRRSSINCIISGEPIVWIDVISHKSDVHDVAFGLNTPWRLIATASNFYEAWWIIQVEYFHVVIWTVAVVPVAPVLPVVVVVVVPLHIEVCKIQIDVVARICSDRPKTIQVIWITEWIIRTCKVPLTILNVVSTRSWEYRRWENIKSAPRSPWTGKKKKKRLQNLSISDACTQGLYPTYPLLPPTVVCTGFCVPQCLSLYYSIIIRLQSFQTSPFFMVGNDDLMCKFLNRIPVVDLALPPYFGKKNK